GSNYVQRVVIKAIKHDIAIYSMHTALDNSNKGVNAKICDVLGLQNTKILIPRTGTIRKLTTYVPKENAEALKSALFHAGAGNIGNYSDCSFTVDGTGSYRANAGANPYLGKIGETQYEDESQISITYGMADEQKILKALFSNHPYEEVAYELQTLENKNQNIGMGIVGNLEKPMGEEEFFEFLKKKMNVSCIRHSNFLGKKIKKIALLGGSGSFAISAAIAVKADVFVTSDLKYHQFYEAE